MKENRYDDAVFFEKYSQVNRSRQGLSGAGEWGAFKKLLPDFAGKRVLDLGCGYGWHCQYAVEHGAAEAMGVDSSRRMLSRARELHTDERIAYRLAAMESLDFPAASFHVVLSSLAFHYVADFPALVGRVAQWLRPGGSFVFSVEHPVFTSVWNAGLVVWSRWDHTPLSGGPLF